MANTFLTLKNAVAAYVGRNKTDFTYFTTEDMLLRAANNAKDFAQRQVDFEYSTVLAQISVGATGASMDSATLAGTATGVTLKCIRKSFLTSSTNELPLQMLSRDAYVNKLARFGGPPSDETYIVQIGRTVYLLPAPTTATLVYVDGIQWLSDFSADGDTNFLLTFCFDYLLFRSILELNFFLKEDQRIPVSAKLLEDTWTSVKAWNASVVYNGLDDVNPL